MSLYTIFGGRGFIGSEFISKLKKFGHEIFIPERNDTSLFSRELGIVIYCAGYGDCNNDPFNVLEANTVLLSKVLKNADFEKLVYISSTRLYMNHKQTNEKTDITVCNNDSRRLFNLTKLAAEELCLKSGKNVLIIRPSNVYGLALNSKLFLPSIVRDALQNKIINMYVDKMYEKDYVSVYDVVDATLKLIEKDSLSNNIYNIASGENIKAIDIANSIKKAIACEVIWHNSKNDELFNVIDISSLNDEITFKPRSMLDDLLFVINDFKINVTEGK